MKNWLAITITLFVTCGWQVVHAEEVLAILHPPTAPGKGTSVQGETLEAKEAGLREKLRNLNQELEAKELQKANEIASQTTQARGRLQRPPTRLVRLG